MLFPFVFMVFTAFRSYDQYIGRQRLLARQLALLFSDLPVVQQLSNSTIVTVGGVALIVVVSTTGGFAFAKLGFPGSSMVLLAILAGMMVPMQSIIIPEFVNVSRVRLINQFPGAILVYAALGAPFATYLMTTYYRGIPTELLEAS